MKFIVFGLGNYGASLACKLVTLGHEVIGVDSRMDVVERWKEGITHTVMLDATNKEAMQTLPLAEAQGAVVAIGETPGISIMVTALLRQLGMKRIVCRVLSPLQRTVLETMGIKEFAYPEADSAERMAYKLDLKGVVDSHKITDRFQLIEVEVPKLLIGSTIDQIDFARKYELTLITVIRPSTEKNIFGSLHVVRESLGLVKGELKLEHGDTLLLFGEVENLERFIEY